MRKSVSLPQIDESLALVCTIPDAGRNERRVTVMSLIAQSSSVRETEAGVALTFDGSLDTANAVVDFTLAERECCAKFTYTIVFQPRGSAIELRIAATDSLVEPLKGLYLGLAQEKQNV